MNRRGFFKTAGGAMAAGVAMPTEPSDPASPDDIGERLQYLSDLEALGLPMSPDDIRRGMSLDFV